MTSLTHDTNVLRAPRSSFGRMLRELFGATPLSVAISAFVARRR